MRDRTDDRNTDTAERAGPPADGLFEPEMWRRADLMALAFETLFDRPPMLGLVFRDPDVAEAIFVGWRHALGAADTDERVRIAIIEGDVPGLAPGYTVHLGADRSATASDPRRDIWRRMPRADSPHLRRFKEAYFRQGNYVLAPAAYGGSVVFMHHVAIAKRRLMFRRVGDIGLVADADSGLWDR